MYTRLQEPPAIPYCGKVNGFDLLGQLVGVSMGRLAPIREPLQSAFLNVECTADPLRDSIGKNEGEHQTRRVTGVAPVKMFPEWISLDL